MQIPTVRTKKAFILATQLAGARYKNINKNKHHNMPTFTSISVFGIQNLDLKSELPNAKEKEKKYGWKFELLPFFPYWFSISNAYNLLPDSKAFMFHSRRKILALQSKGSFIFKFSCEIQAGDMCNSQHIKIWRKHKFSSGRRPVKISKV